MVTKLRLAAAVLALCLALTGCMKIENTIEDLMSPPKLSEEQENIFAALYASAGDDISLKYPKTGENRSAFVMKDLDSDGVNEALVFYTSNIMGDNVRINVLDCINGEWVSLYECVGMGPEVESVSFPHMTSAEAGNIVIAYNMLNRKDKVIAVYSYNSERIVEKFSQNIPILLFRIWTATAWTRFFLLTTATERMFRRLRLSIPQASARLWFTQPHL